MMRPYLLPVPRHPRRRLYAQCRKAADKDLREKNAVVCPPPFPPALAPSVTP